jgi:hypothetical protein
MAERTVAAAVLLPLRAFLGITCLDAGIDKLVSPHPFVAGDPFSVAGQMAGYAQTSPLAPLIEAAMPAAVAIGLLITLAELAIGPALPRRCARARRSSTSTAAFASARSPRAPVTRPAPSTAPAAERLPPASGSGRPGGRRWAASSSAGTCGA